MKTDIPKTAKLSWWCEEFQFPYNVASQKDHKFLSQKELDMFFAG